MEKYINIYKKRNYKMGIFCAIIVFIPLFVVSLIFDVISYDIAISFLPFLLSFLCVLFANLHTIRFRKMIREQENLYNIEFNDNNVEHLETTLYLSDDWLICAGSSAFNKKHISSIKTRVECGRSGISNRIIIKTIDNKKYSIWCLNDKNIKKIKKWQKI